MQICLVSLGVFVHLVLLYGIFDVYYSSPLVKISNEHRSTDGLAPAKRLVLFVADGLRAESLFEKTAERAPFLNGLIENCSAMWGISQSHVPTESRPGHVALIAGFYEDVSAVTKGWRENPVPFDSLFNRSRNTWSWGSPDILPMFSKGTSDGRMYTEMYESENEDFAHDDASMLDSWVFDRVESFLNKSADDFHLYRLLHQDRVVFFLHLLGLDTNGHGHKPRSRRYIDNIGVVDAGLRKLAQLFTSYYGDDSTAFLFTSDHGMTDWGSHGAGSHHEIDTPVVAWGAGLHRSCTGVNVSQVDLTPLMASLLGVAFPVHSRGHLPLAYLSSSSHYRYRASCANLAQLIEQFAVLKSMKKRRRSVPFLFHEFAAFRPQVHEFLDKTIAKLVEQKRFETAANVCSEWMSIVADGIDYFHRYERSFLGVVIASVYVSWIFLMLLAMTTKQPIEIGHFRPSNCAFFTAIGVFLLLEWQQLPVSNRIYCLLPIYLLSICGNFLKITTFPTLFFPPFSSNSPIFVVLLFIPAVLLFVVLFTERWSISVTLILIGFWPHLFPTKTIARPDLAIPWTVCCAFLSIFPLLPTVGQTPVWSLAMGMPIVIGFGMVYSIRIRSMDLLDDHRHWTSLLLFASLIFLSSLLLLSIATFLSGFLVGFTRHSPSFGRPFALQFCRFCSWFLLLIVPFTPLTSDANVQNRLIHWSLALFVPYSLLSIGYESLFYWGYAILLYIYVRIEFNRCQLYEGTFSMLDFTDFVSPDTQTKRSISSWIRAFLLVFFVLLSFFGTGNVASLNSFNPSFVGCFVTIFSPFIMTGLLLFKVLVPFILTAIVFYTVQSMNGGKVEHLASISLVITNAMALIFFFRLKDDGSWQEIGISISHYVICLSMALVLFLLLQFASFVTSYQLCNFSRRKMHII